MCCSCWLVLGEWGVVALGGVVFSFFNLIYKYAHCGYSKKKIFRIIATKQSTYNRFYFEDTCYGAAFVTHPSSLSNLKIHLLGRNLICRSDTFISQTNLIFSSKKYILFCYHIFKFILSLRPKNLINKSQAVFSRIICSSGARGDFTCTAYRMCLFL
jgi:hypothetical protein